MTLPNSSRLSAGTDLSQIDAVGLAALIRSGQLSPTEAIQSTIDRIEHLNGELNAVIHEQYEQALELAASPKLPDGPFRGVPMLIKDLWSTEAGQPHHAGNRALKEMGFIADADSNLVTRYKQAGFVIVGRTNTPELGLVATTEPEVYGPSRNPWNTKYSPGGSSGGAAAAVAAGILPAANASDGGGSIRIPAAMCGLVGLKPSRGRVSQGPREEWSFSCQHVVTQTMRDTAAILDASALPFPGDGVIAPDHGRPYAECVEADLGPLRIGFMPDNHRSETHPDCVAATRRTADLLADLGHAVVESRPEAFLHLGELKELAWAFTVNWSAGAVVNLRIISDQLGRALTVDDVEAGTWAMAERGQGYTAPDYLRSQGILGDWRRSMASWWSDFDLLLTPTTAQPPAQIGKLTPTDSDPVRGSRGSLPYSVYTSPFNCTGQPAISLPMGSSDGLPVGIQLVAAYGREDQLLSVGRQLERIANWSASRAPIHA
ncbi:MAG: amidase [Acidimicrobiales bacterium]|nr:amidase [Acidimicrobiales bacterium]